MPPKKKPNEPNKKTVDKQKAKVVEDKTFGLKNKKGSKQQKFIQHVQKTVTQSTKTAKQLAKDQEDKDKRKEDKRKQQDELNDLFKPADQRIAKGVDPKSVLCAFFKVGQCTKGDKCKFSHDLNIGRKAEKRNMYEDADDGNEDSMVTWDEAKLEEVINQKHGEANKSLPKSTIVCKYFLEAVEGNKYGWFWACPNGENCHYRHALPPGYVLKRDQKKESEDEKISLEELVEKERAALNAQNLTRVTLETFLQWKDRKRKEKMSAFEKAKDQRKQDFKAGKSFGVSGREMFEFNPDLVVNEAEDGDEGVDISQYKRDDEDADPEAVGPVVDISLEQFSAVSYNPATDVITVASKEKRVTSNKAAASGSTEDDEAGKLDMAAAIVPTGNSKVDEAIALAQSAVVVNGDLGGSGDMAIDEELFLGDDLLEVEEELETLELDD